MHFFVGYFYHKGDYIERGIQKAIHYYKEDSSFNDQYAKNNLAIIYKNGYGDEIRANTAKRLYFTYSDNVKRDLVTKGIHNDSFFLFLFLFFHFQWRQLKRIQRNWRACWVVHRLLWMT